MRNRVNDAVLGAVVGLLQRGHHLGVVGDVVEIQGQHQVAIDESPALVLGNRMRGGDDVGRTIAQGGEKIIVGVHIADLHLQIHAVLLFYKLDEIPTVGLRRVALPDEQLQTHGLGRSDAAEHRRDAQNYRQGCC